MSKSFDALMALLDEACGLVSGEDDPEPTVIVATADGLWVDGEPQG